MFPNFQPKPSCSPKQIHCAAQAEQHISATMPKVRALTDRIRSGRLASTHQRMPDSKFQASLPPARDQQSVLSRGFNMRAWLPSASTHRLVAEHPPDVRVLVPLSTNLHASGAAWLRYPHGYIQVRRLLEGCRQKAAAMARCLSMSYCSVVCGTAS